MSVLLPITARYLCMVNYRGWRRTESRKKSEVRKKECVASNKESAGATRREYKRCGNGDVSEERGKACREPSVAVCTSVER